MDARAPWWLVAGLSLLVGGGTGCASARRARADGGPTTDAARSDGGIDAGAIDAALADASADAGMPSDAHVATDAGSDGGTDAGSDGGRDAGSDAGHDGGRDAGPVTGASIPFPTASDTSVKALTGYWNAGDYVEGSRTTTFSTVTRLTLNVAVMSNGLSCDTQDMNVTLNGVMIGAFQIHAGQTTVTDALVFAPVAGPTYAIRFETSSTVEGGCGGAGIDRSASSIVLSP